MAKFGIGRWAVVAMALGAASAPGWAVAQATGTPQAGVLPTPQQLNPAQQTEAQPRAREGDVLAPPGAGACLRESSPLGSIKLTGVEFQGLGPLTPADLAPAYEHLVGQVITISTLCEIRDRAAAIIFHKGILARVDIPPQTIGADGHLVLKVIEARIASVRVIGDAGPAQAKVEDYIERLRGLTPFDLRTAQRYLLLASDVPGVQVSAALQPSGQGPGAVDMVVTVKRTPVNLLANVQNFGSHSLGPWGGLARADFNGFTALGERTTLVAYSTLFDDEQLVAQLVEEARFGSDGLLGRLSLAYGRTHPGGDLTPLDLHGTSFVASAQLVYPLLRTRRRDVNLTGGFDLVDQKTDFGGGGTLTDDKLRIFHARLDLDDKEYFGGRETDLAGGLEIRQGIAGLGASPAGQPNLSRLEGHADATVLRADGHWLTQWSGKFSTQVAFQAQYANEPVLVYEELEIGNLTIGRGYDPSSVAGDRGVAGSFEARLGPYRISDAISVQGYAFYDVAYVKTIDTGGDSRTVTSAGGGLRINFTPRLSVDVAFVQPFDKVSILAPSRPPSRVLVSLVARFP